MNLKQLTNLVLNLSETPLTRIRLAKTIYFVHKELTRKKLMQSQDIAYIRLPLGPTPDGLSNIIANHPEIITRNITNTNLLYENTTFTSNQTQSTDYPPEIANTTKKTIKLLQNYPTPHLVRASQDPSWFAHKNGESYHFTQTDLKNPFPNNPLGIKIHIKTTPKNEIGALQATLLRGMLTDIVKESTDLEYPDQSHADQDPQDGDSIKLHKFTIKFPSWPKKKPQ